MLEEARQRMHALQDLMCEAGIARAVFTDESSIACLAGFRGYLGVEFGRPTMLVVRAEDAPVVITPLMESEMVSEMTWIEDVRSWEDMGQRTWGRALTDALDETPQAIWVELGSLPAIVRNYLDEAHEQAVLKDISPLLGQMRMNKSPLEIEVMRQAGKSAGVMMKAAHDSLAEGAREYESALAEDVAAAANEVYAARGHETGYRTGRSIDDSIVVTQAGAGYLTGYPREILLSAS